MLAWTSVHLPDVALDTPAAPARLRVHDASTSRLVEVGPEHGTARLYVCGITPYDATHLGHANTYVAFDLLNRAWRDLGLDVSYAQNVTDVDDPLLERATATGQDWTELAAEQTQLFRDDMTALRVLPPQAYVGAVESIPQVIELVEHLRQKGAVYQLDDPEYPDWYFRSELAQGFGTIGHLTPHDMVARFTEMGGDPERAGKLDPLDCLVWRMARPDEPSWPSPFGAGRPGWHIECTAIALDALGPQFDVQGGGSDLAFPHHEMCAAEGVMATGQKFAKAYVHSGMVALDGEKMSKSKGNLELVSRLRARGVEPMAIRLALLGHHYRSDWEYSANDLERAEARLDLWRAAVDQQACLDPTEAVAAARQALRTDLDAPRALAAVDAWASASISATEELPGAGQTMARFLDAVLGIEL